MPTESVAANSEERISTLRISTVRSRGMRSSVALQAIAVADDLEPGQRTGLRGRLAGVFLEAAEAIGKALDPAERVDLGLDGAPGAHLEDAARPTGSDETKRRNSGSLAPSRPMQLREGVAAPDGFGLDEAVEGLGDFER